MFVFLAFILLLSGMSDRVVGYFGVKSLRWIISCIRFSLVNSEYLYGVGVVLDVLGESFLILECLF